MSAPYERLSAALADRYRIERELGAGGMATVYLAHDIKHDRHVALKVLKPELAAVLGAERFVVEIKTTAALQHPHILPLFDSGSADGFLFYVMPFIQGETLRDKLNRETQLGVDESVRIARDVADALDYAHRHGVIHRDIKPENILLHDGRPMVADFGIALALSAAAGGRMTETGLSLGTPHYMSPEQATAEKEITARSDVYSLGSVLYEMLAGQPPHLGGSAQQIVMKIIAEPVQPVTTHRKSVPPNVAAAVLKSLEKLPADRFESAKAFGDALANPAYTSTTFGNSGIVAARNDRRALVAMSIVAVLALTGAAWGWLRPAPIARVARVDIRVDSINPSGNGDMEISPDGSMLATSANVNGEQAIYLRHLDGDAEFRKLSGTENGTAPSFSPDNQWIVFTRVSERALIKVSVSGGGTTTLVKSDSILPFYPHWGTDNHIVFTNPSGAFRISSAGGMPERLHGVFTRSVFLLPDGSGVLFSQNADVALLNFKTDSIAVLIPNATYAVYVETGHILYIGDAGALYAVPFSLGKHKVTGPAVRVLENVEATPSRRGYSVSRSGILVQRRGRSTLTTSTILPTRLVVMGFAGDADTIPLPPGRRMWPRFSPNGRFISYEAEIPGRTGKTDIYTFDLITGTSTQMTFDGDNDDAVWSPDGTRILFDKDFPDTKEDLLVKAADNSGTEKSILTMPGDQNPLAWISEDTILVFHSQTTGGQGDLLIYSPKGGGKPKAYLEAPWDEDGIRVSPDHKFAVFTSEETRPRDVWLRNFPVPEGKWRVSNGGGEGARWSPDGNYIYFWRRGVVDTLFKARVDRTPSVVVRPPVMVLATTVFGAEDWDIHPDGKRFIVVVPDVPSGTSTAARATAGPRYIMALNWFTELKALTARGSR